MHPLRKAAKMLAVVVGSSILAGHAAACKCAVPSPPPPGKQPAPRVPSLDGDVAVFVGLVEEIYPKNLKAYGRQWRRMYREDLPNEWISTESSVEKLRDFILRLWAPIYSTEERRLLNSARSLDELDEAMPGFWITPRRIRLKIIELFAGPSTRKIVLIPGLRTETATSISKSASNGMWMDFAMTVAAGSRACAPAPVL